MLKLKIIPKLTVYKDRKKIKNEYIMVSFKTKQYDNLKKYHNTFVTKEDAERILKWLARSCGMNLNINFRNCERPWGGVRRDKAFVTIAKTKTIGIIIHEFSHAHNYSFGTGRNHNDGFIRTLDKYINKFYKSKAKEIVEIKEKYKSTIPNESICNAISF